MKLIGWLVGALVALLLILFAVSNRAQVGLRLEPLPFLIELPLYAAMLAVLVIGFVSGGFLAWLGGGKWRRRARRAESDAERLRSTLAEARTQGAQRPANGPAAADASRQLPRAS
jgi:putative membrane protein